MNGIINIYKEEGFTSFDVVAKLRGILKTRKIGHTGTLDPSATGVLPVTVGNATKVCELITDKVKEYKATVLLGVQTDTLDMDGQILREDKDIEVNEEEIKTVVSSFLGEIKQIPPMYSAIKINGKKLYEYAREGKEVERKERVVTIFDIKVTDFNLSKNRFDIVVSCSKGTYIRSLCADIGEKLGTVAVMEKLLRTRSGEFYLDNAHKISEVEEIVKEGRIDEILLPVDIVFSKYESVYLDGSLDKILYNGGWFDYKDFGLDKDEIYGDKNSHVRVYDSKGEFKAIYKLVGNNFKPEKMFL
ncbi:MAG: tRNA pseudouridine(55) synthase TruB [Lachnospiraceae bacterium]|nr:tRNA pseudouridine(55) synthase TruB [Lachnospiraceae bacterium]